MAVTLLDASKTQPSPKQSDERPSKASARQRTTLTLSLLQSRAQEYAQFDSILARQLIGTGGYVGARLLGCLGHGSKEFAILSKLHRGDFSAPARRRAERLIAEAVAGRAPSILSMFQRHFHEYTPTASTARFFDEPQRMLGTVILVLKSPTREEKGAILLLYSYTLPLLGKLFDLDRIAKRYHLILEPSWSGYCDLDILCYCGRPFPVFVQAYEPRDAQLIKETHSNLIVVPISNNWWVDHRLFFPLPDGQKEFDVVMVAGWGAYKRHYRFFAALAELRRRGTRLQALLLGYPLGKTKDDILELAQHFGIDKQIEIHEWIPYEQMNEHINRAKVNVLWSRREGFNRAIIEGMFADVPCIIREGHNYGYKYPYVNSQTGCFANEGNLPERLLRMVKNYESFRPRQWVLENMSCHRATEILSDVIGRTCAERGEQWSGGLAVKVNKLHSLEYWNPEDRQRFADDYEFLHSALRR
jgi:glycosyltransferase involved in cell wall biosynthesis